MKKSLAILAIMCITSSLSVTAAPITEKSVVKESTVSKTDFTGVEANFTITAKEVILTDVTITGELVKENTPNAMVKKPKTTEPFISTVVWLKNQGIRQLFCRTVSTG